MRQAAYWRKLLASGGPLRFASGHAPAGKHGEVNRVSEPAHPPLQMVEKDWLQADPGMDPSG